MVGATLVREEGGGCYSGEGGGWWGATLVREEGGGDATLVSRVLSSG